MLILGHPPPPHVIPPTDNSPPVGVPPPPHPRGKLPGGNTRGGGEGDWGKCPVTIMLYHTKRHHFAEVWYE